MSSTIAPHEPVNSAAAPLYLDTQQVAEMLGVDQRTVERWASSDPTMPVLRRGRVVRYPRARLEAWLDAQLPRAARKGSTLQAQRSSLTS
jgi:excisionase family DNA binding protein